MSKIRSQGFTLIELLVVIAIIGILSAVVLASLSTARTKGADAAIQSDLATIQTQAEIYYGNNGNKYNTNGTTGLAAGSCASLANTLLADPNIAAAVTGAVAANGGAIGTVTVCAIANDGSSYAASFQSKVTPTNYFCVDSTGNVTSNSTKKATGGAAAAAVCA